MNDLNRTNTSSYFNLTKSFLKDTTLRGRDPRTSRQYAKIVGRYLEMAGTQNLNMESTYLDHKPGLMDFLGYLRDSHHKYPTLKGYFTALNCFFDFLIDNGYVTVNPIPVFRARYLTIYKTPEPPKYKQWTPDEILMLIVAAHNVLWKAVIALFAATGMRRGELVALNIGDVDFENRTLHLHDHKKRSNRDIVFTDWALSYLLDYMDLRIK